MVAELTDRPEAAESWGSPPAAYRAAYRARRPQGGAVESVTTVLESVVPAQGASVGRRTAAAVRKVRRTGGHDAQPLRAPG